MQKTRTTFLWLLGSLLNLATVAQVHISKPALKPNKWTPSEIHQKIKKLNFLGSVLYVAAHPDDENTRMISYLSNEVHARTAYLSLTRGDGGQNLIGPEIRELLGVIRTQELLMARSVDGGEQMFTRANDFGYSKHPDETMATWNKDEVIGDAVWAMRRFKPDVIINRFDHNSAGRTHGHHTASAVIANMAYKMASDPSQYSDQLRYVEPWQAKRQFFNTSWWFYGSREKFEAADKSDMVTVDIGTYYPWAGKSNTEIASESRSMHKCQGFGSTGTRGERMEYLQLIHGDMPTDNDIFQGINTSWTRLKGGKAIEELLSAVERNFDFQAPEKSLYKLVQAYQLIEKLEDKHWRSIKQEEILEIIAQCAGLYLEAASSEQHLTNGESFSIDVEAINRSKGDFILERVAIRPSLKDSLINAELNFNQKLEYTTPIELLDDHALTGHYWLLEEGSLGMYKVNDRLLIGRPESPRALFAHFDLRYKGALLRFKREVIYKFNDPEKGEVYRPLEIIPEASVAVEEKVVLFPNEMAKEIHVEVKAGKENLNGELTLDLPKGWEISPQSHTVAIEKKGDSRSFKFSIIPPSESSSATLVPLLKVEDKTYSRSMIEIDYDHIPYQTVLLNAATKMVRFDLEKGSDRIAYIMGAGDVVPEQLRQVGYTVDELDIETLSTEDLEPYATVLMGIRAYNKWDVLKFKQSILMNYVEQGGTLISQYNTTWNRKMDEIGPFPFHISRDRVTREDAEVRFLTPKHPVLNAPNKITSRDFEGWVQERGLYFADEWDEDFTPILSANDPGEDARDGGLLVANYGEGYYVYTGYSFFRELPAGVPGAYRLLANILALGNDGE